MNNVKCYVDYQLLRNYLCQNSQVIKFTETDRSRWIWWQVNFGKEILQQFLIQLWLFSFSSVGFQLSSSAVMQLVHQNSAERPTNIWATGGWCCQDQAWKYSYWASGRWLPSLSMEMQLLGIGRVASRTKHGSAVIWHQDVASKLLPGSSMEIQLLGIRRVAVKTKLRNPFFSMRMVAARTKHGNVTQMQLQCGLVPLVTATWCNLGQITCEPNSIGTTPGVVKKIIGCEKNNKLWKI